MSNTPRTDREVYRITKGNVDANEGFAVVNPALCRELELEVVYLASLLRLVQQQGGFEAHHPRQLVVDINAAIAKAPLPSGPQRAPASKTEAQRPDGAGSTDAIDTLRELVRLKNIKERIDTANATVAEREDYRRNKAAAWTNARRLVGAVHSASGGGE